MVQAQQSPNTDSNLVATQLVGSDLVIYLGDRTLVQSKSHPGQWRVVERGVCDCPGFAARGKCRHVLAALQVEEEDRETVAPIEEPDMVWAGWHRGWEPR